MLSALEADLEANVAVCGHVRVTPEGSEISREPAVSVPAGSAFETVARRPLGAIHAHVVRRDAVADAGGFDVGLSTCEDWDLWVRVARTGARFLTVSGVFVPYRNAPGTLSRNGGRFVHDARTVLFRAGPADDRVVRADTRYATGTGTEAIDDICGWIAL